ncbi:amino acid permease [Paenibacillus illinoisensis]|uniref:amino acid permease n=1 Tax=Paenibacillus illinoisensis TaxID=59845 RepID=UPI000FD9BAE2|nr:amino acid permease [Paenibacillus illinoisensis]
MTDLSCAAQDASSSSEGKEKGNLKWWQLSLLGIGCTIGTGYFLGSGIGIKQTGPSMVLSFLIAALGTYIVFHFLAKMTTADPQEGSFCYYAGKAFGRWARFGCGWNYWSTKILIMGSQLTALSILSRFWFPNVPLWVFAAGYAILSIFVVLLGTQWFDKIENVLAVVKTAAIVMFILLAAAALFGWIHGGSNERPGMPSSAAELFPGKFPSFWSSLLYAFYAYGGVETIGLMSIQLQDKKDAPKAGKVMLTGLSILYMLSIGMAVFMVHYTKMNEKESPFVTALSSYHLEFFPHVFNGAIILAGFSAMSASLFAVVNLLVTMSKDGDAPKLFKAKLKFKQLPLPSLVLAAVGLCASIVTALLLPGKIYEYITTAAGILQMYNWSFIIIAAFKILQIRARDVILGISGLVLLLGAVSGTLMKPDIRVGFYVSLIMIFVIALFTWIMTRWWKKHKVST